MLYYDICQVTLSNLKLPCYMQTMSYLRESGKQVISIRYTFTLSLFPSILCVEARHFNRAAQTAIVSTMHATILRKKWKFNLSSYCFSPYNRYDSLSLNRR